MQPKKKEGFRNYFKRAMGDDLVRERSTASFNVETMTTLLDGSETETARRRWIWSSTEEIDSDEVRVHAEQPRGELMGDALERFMAIHKPYFDQGFRPKGQDMAHMSDAKSGITGGLSLHYGVFLSTLRSQSSEEQKRWWVEKATRLGFIGCYAQTELAHGSNVRGLQTTATYDAATEEWVLNTPTIGSMKWWSTGLYSSTHGVVYAQMLLGDKEMGVHVFFVQLGLVVPAPGYFELGLESGYLVGHFGRVGLFDTYRFFYCFDAACRNCV